MREIDRSNRCYEKKVPNNQFNVEDNTGKECVRKRVKYFP